MGTLSKIGTLPRPCRLVDLRQAYIRRTRQLLQATYIDLQKLKSSKQDHNISGQHYSGYTFGEHGLINPATDLAYRVSNYQREKNGPGLDPIIGVSRRIKEIEKDLIVLLPDCIERHSPHYKVSPNAREALSSKTKGLLDRLEASGSNKIDAVRLTSLLEGEMEELTHEDKELEELEIFIEPTLCWPSFIKGILPLSEKRRFWEQWIDDPIARFLTSSIDHHFKHAFERLALLNFAMFGHRSLLPTLQRMGYESLESFLESQVEDGALEKHLLKLAAELVKSRKELLGMSRGLMEKEFWERLSGVRKPHSTEDQHIQIVPEIDTKGYIRLVKDQVQSLISDRNLEVLDRALEKIKLLPREEGVMMIKDAGELPDGTRISLMPEGEVFSFVETMLCVNTTAEFAEEIKQ